MERSQRLTLVATILGSTIVFLDTTVINVALPAIEQDLGAGLSGQQWVVEAYLLTLVSLLLVGGSMGDQFGRRRIFMIGLGGFGLTSAACALAPSTEFLVAARSFQGIAGALLVPGSLALIAAAFEGPARGRAIGTWTAWSGIATVIGPAGGGALVEGLSWHWVFWINVPLVALTFWMARAAIAESRDPEASRSLDFGGVALSIVGLGGPVFALIEQPARGWGDPLVWAPLTLGLLALGAFIAHERRTPNPMLRLGLFRIRNFAVANLATLMVYAALTASIFFITIYLQQVAGYSALEAGLALTPVSVLLFLLSPQFGKLSSLIGPRLPMTIGPAVAGGGMLLLSGIGADPGYVEEILPGALLFGLGLSATVAPLTTTVLDAVGEGQVGIASGVSNAFARVAGLLAIAAVGAVVASQFAAELREETAQLPRTPAVERAVDRAQAEVFTRGPDQDRLPEATAAELDEAAARSSSSALQSALILCAALMFAGAAISALGLRSGAPATTDVSQPS